jgi:hypothetical protein
MKLSKTYKVEHYDAVKQDRDKLSLAMFDLVNGKFSKPVTVREKDYLKGLDGVMNMRLSWRGMPLFLIEWSVPGNQHISVSVYTESELDDITRDASSTGNRMLRDAFHRCKREYYPKAA